MPYLSPEDKGKFEVYGNKSTKGAELNFQISTLLNCFIVMKGLSYASINEAMGALECAKLEFYRKVAADYEDMKEINNGTVWNYKQEKQ